MNIRRKLITTTVERILSKHKIVQPPIDVASIAREFGVTILEEPHTDDSLSGFLYRDLRSNTAIIGVNKGHSPTRRRFTIAHELGHFCLHAFEAVHVDKAGYGSGFGRLKLRDESSSAGIDPEEVEANFFAAELLMPARFLEHELRRYPNLDFLDESSFNEAVRSLAKQFKVSPQSLSIRLVQLGLLHVN
jgi:Zn-dependent peptidase ImmA (M78 family)